MSLDFDITSDCGSRVEFRTLIGGPGGSTYAFAILYSTTVQLTNAL